MIEKIRKSMIGSAVLGMVMGAIILIFPQITALAICYMFGAALVIYGVVKLAGYFAREDMGYMFRFDLMTGIAYLVLGVLLIMHPGAIMAAIPTILAIVLIINGIIKIQLAMEARGMGYGHWWTSLVCAVLEMVLAVLMIANPFESANMLFMFIGASYIVDGALDLYTILRVSKGINDFRRMY